MIHYDFSYKGFKVRAHYIKVITHTEETEEEITNEFEYHHRSIAWNAQNQFYRGDPFPMRAESQEAAIAAIDVMLRVAP